MNPGEDYQQFLSRFPMEAFCYDSPFACSLMEDDAAYVVYSSEKAAGAIGKPQGEALLQALAALETRPAKTLSMLINSSGAHFAEPMEGLFYLNALIDALWAFRMRGITLKVCCNSHLYGGAALALSTVAHEITLTPTARLGLFGTQVNANAPQSPIPAKTVQPVHLTLVRSCNLP